MRTWTRRLRPCLLALPLLLLVAGCKKNDQWGEEIGAPAADVNEIREKARQKKATKGAPEPGQPGQPGQP